MGGPRRRRPLSSGTAEILWLCDTPIAVLERRAGSSDDRPSGGGSPTAWQGTPAGGVEVFYLHPDHLDTPRVLVNASNQPVWRWDSAPFGDTDATEQPTAGIPSFRFSLRFLGQQYDQETGTHYNYFRDYEPGVGRYVQSDPVGLWGGVNTYVYVWSSPNFASDHLGLFSPHFVIRPPGQPQGFYPELMKYSPSMAPPQCDGYWVQVGSVIANLDFLGPLGFVDKLVCRCVWLCRPCSGAYMWSGDPVDLTLPRTTGTPVLGATGEIKIGRNGRHRSDINPSSCICMEPTPPKGCCGP